MPKISYIAELKHVLERLDVDKGDVCIVGSGVMAYYDIRKNNDLDIIMDNKHRKTDNNFRLSENVECVKKGWLYHVDETTDESIIYNSNLHFVHDGLKFCNLELVRKRKKWSMRVKDKKDLRLIDDRS